MQGQAQVQVSGLLSMPVVEVLEPGLRPRVAGLHFLLGLVAPLRTGQEASQGAQHPLNCRRCVLGLSRQPGASPLPSAVRVQTGTTCWRLHLGLGTRLTCTFPRPFAVCPWRSPGLLSRWGWGPGVCNRACAPGLWTFGADLSLQTRPIGGMRRCFVWTVMCPLPLGWTCFLGSRLFSWV